MKVTLKQLEQLYACKEGVEWYKRQGTEDLCTLVKASIKDGMVEMRFANWGIVRLMTHKQKAQYTVYAARQVLKIFEDKYPKDKRPRWAIEAAEKWIKEPTEENRKAASAASAASYAAASAASSAAASAAYSAAASAAASANAYANAYAANAAKARLMAKILRYGVKLLMEVK